MNEIRDALEAGLALQERYYGNATDLHIEMIEWAKRARAALSSPHPEAREEDIEIGTPREFAERLAWMTVNGKPDLDQWENHIKFRDAALSRLARKDELLRRAIVWLRKYWWTREGQDNYKHFQLSKDLADIGSEIGELENQRDGE